MMLPLLFWALVIWVAAGGGPTFFRDARARAAGPMRDRASAHGPSSVSWWALGGLRGGRYVARSAWRGWGHHYRWARKKIDDYRAQDDTPPAKPKDHAGGDEHRPATPDTPAGTGERGGDHPLCVWRVDGPDPRCGQPVVPGSIYCADHKAEFDAFDPDPDDSGPEGGTTPERPANVTPINRPGSPQPANNSAGGNHVTTMTAEAHGYEETLAAYESDITVLEEQDAIYEHRIGVLRSVNADDASIEDVARQREINESAIAAARETRDNWVSRHGAVKEAKDATGTRGDEALYSTG